LNSRLQRGLNWLHRLEDWLLTVLVVGLVVLAGSQIVLRNVFDHGLTWADPLLRAMVLWSAMLGALVATREDQHIGLDFVARFTHGAARRIAHVVAHLFAAGLCGAMAWHGVGLVQLDLDGSAHGAAGIPSWLLEAIIPAAFALMALRFFLRALGAPKPAHTPGDSIEESAGESRAVEELVKQVDEERT
jgi:TRAP-type C4-dicarboxylate transport system permease small subunit